MPMPGKEPDMIDLYYHRSSYEQHVEECETCQAGRACKDAVYFGDILEDARELAKLKTSDLLLLLIEQRTTEDGHGWHPSQGNETLQGKRGGITLLTTAHTCHSALRSLLRKGEIMQVKSDAVIYRITEHGKLRAQTIA